MNALLLGTALLVNAPALKEAPKNVGGIAGEWIPESMSMAGKAAPNTLAKVRYQFSADGQWTILRDEGKATALPRNFKLDLKADPKTIDVEPVKRAAAVAGKPMLGIWKVEGDTLTICFSIGGDERPNSFEQADGARTMKMVLRRVKPVDGPIKK